MFSVPRLIIGLAFFLFVAHCLALPLEEVHDAVLVAGASASSASVAAAATADSVGVEAAITVTIVQPTLCKASDVQYSTKTVIPTGQIQIFPDQNAG